MTFTASVLFYAYGEPHFVFVMLFSIIVNYFIALLIDKTNTIIYRKLLLSVAIIINVGMLWLYKYSNFTIRIINHLIHRNMFNQLKISLPIGISFFTFQILSYVIDVYRKKVNPQRNIINLALYISFFPQLIAGPIVRYIDMEKQLEINNRRFNQSDFFLGFKRFMIGFCKKILIANNLSEIVQKVFACNYSEANILYLWLGAVCFTFQIYYDFSGYSDMAIGLGKMFGFDIPENFNYPYMAESATDFWRRWHMSLSQWFRDYVYIPLGGNRRNILRTIFNLFVVWTLTGIWHGAGAQFLFWGISWFTVLIIEKYIINIEEKGKFLKFVWHIITGFVIVIEWVVFNSESLGNAIVFIKSMFGLYGNGLVIDNMILVIMEEYWFFIICAIIFSIPFKNMINKINKKLISIVETIIVAWCFVWSVSYLVLGVNNPFLYFNF